jgi:hypothetical protein
MTGVVVEMNVGGGCADWFLAHEEMCPLVDGQGMILILVALQ